MHITKPKTTRLATSIAALSIAVSSLAGCGAGTSTTGAPAPSAGMSTADLRSELLTLNDLPSGWTTGDTTRSQDSTGGAPTGCAGGAAGPNAAAEADTSFVQGQGVPELDESLSYFGPQVYTAWAQGTAQLDGCKEFTFTTDGTKVSGAMSPMAFPDLGDGAVAYQMVLRGTVSGVSVPIRVDLVAVRQDQTIVTVMESGPTAPDRYQLQDLVQAATQKVS